MKNFKIIIALALMLLVSCNNVKKDKFIGAWISYETYPPTEGPDQSMIGQISQLNNYQNTKETYVFNFLGNEIIMKKAGSSELTSLYGNNEFKLKLDTKKDILILQLNFSDDTSIEKVYYKRLE